MPALANPAAIGSLNSPFLEGLTPRERDTILAAASPRRFSANTAITMQGQPANRLFLLTKGRVRYFYNTSEGRKILLIWMAPGDVFGGAALIVRPSFYLISCEAVKDSEVLVWERATIRRRVEQCPRLLDNALTIALDTFDWYTTAHVVLSFHTARERLARVLLGLAHAIGEKVTDGIEFDVTNEELANSANITPYTTSRLMSEWQRSRVVVKRRGKILLRTPERLLIHPV